MIEDISLVSKLKSEVDRCDWRSLKSHHKRKALFIVSEGLDLITVGEAIAKDDLLQVKSWLEEKLLSQADENFAAKYESTKDKILFDALIVQPFVLAKHINS